MTLFSRHQWASSLLNDFDLKQAIVEQFLVSKRKVFRTLIVSYYDSRRLPQFALTAGRRKSFAFRVLHRWTSCCEIKTR